MSKISDIEAAKRCARAIASDISLYNTDKIKEAIEKDNFFEELHDEIEEGRQYYKNKVADEIYTQYNFFDRALIDVILKNKGTIKSPLW